MKVVGIVLVCLQVIALIGGFASGSVLGMLTSGPAGLFELAGFLLMGIIGVILIYKAKKKEGK